MGLAHNNELVRPWRAYNCYYIAQYILIDHLYNFIYLLLTIIIYVQLYLILCHKRTITPLHTLYLIQRLSVTVQHGNTASVLGTMKVDGQ